MTKKDKLLTRLRHHRFNLAAALLIVLGIFIGLQTNLYQSVWHSLGTKNNLIYQAVPDLPLTDSAGDITTISDIATEVDDFHFLNFFASWCTPCLAEHPYLFDLSAETDLPIIGIVIGDTVENIDEYLERHGNPYTHIYYAQAAQSMQFGLRGLPETFLVDDQAMLRYRHGGMIRRDDIAGNFIPALQKLRD